MTFPADDGGPEFDEVVDVICVGSDPGPLGYAIACAAAGLDVMVTERPARYDDDTAAYLSAMISDLAGGQAQTQLVTTRARAAAAAGDRRATVEPFVGEMLREWSSGCAASPFGVILTEVPAHMTPMCSEHGEQITAAVVGESVGAESLSRWLRGQAGRYGVGEFAGTFAGLVHHEGRLAGAAVDGPAGRRLAGARAGLAFGVPAAAGPDAGVPAGARVAVLGRRAGRFARLELLVAADE